MHSNGNEKKSVTTKRSKYRLLVGAQSVYVKNTHLRGYVELKKYTLEKAPCQSTHRRSDIAVRNFLPLLSFALKESDDRNTKRHDADINNEW